MTRAIFIAACFAASCFGAFLGILEGEPSLLNAESYAVAGDALAAVGCGDERAYMLRDLLPYVLIDPQQQPPSDVYETADEVSAPRSECMEGSGS